VTHALGFKPVEELTPGLSVFNGLIDLRSHVTWKAIKKVSAVPYSSLDTATVEGRPRDTDATSTLIQGYEASTALAWITLLSRFARGLSALGAGSSWFSYLPLRCTRPSRKPQKKLSHKPTSTPVALRFWFANDRLKSITTGYPRQFSNRIPALFGFALAQTLLVLKERTPSSQAALASSLHVASSHWPPMVSHLPIPRNLSFKP